MKRKLLLPLLLAMVIFLGTAFKNDYFEIAKQVEIFTTLFKELNMNYVDETNPAELMDKAIKNMLEDLDPYTQFMNEQDVESFRINAAGEYSGIGALVRNIDDQLVILEPYKGYPADKAGLKAGDAITQIGDVKVADFSEEASELLKGASNSQVEVTFLRQGKTMTTTLKREEIEIDAVPFFKLIDQKTGYIALTRFNNKASEQTRAALQSLKAEGADRIILDLRGNPGGLLSEAIEVCNLFVPKDELIVSTRSKVNKFNQEYRTRKKPEDTEIPLTILIDDGSASASEIVSGALQDLDRAVIIGGQSFGKGLVQRPVKLAYGTQLKVTISRYYTPSGRCLQAMDYWNRDENGKPIKTSSQKSYKTRNGRTVYEGGGVTPDVAMESHVQNDWLEALEENQLIFNYATQYYYSHPDLDLANFKLTQQDLNTFRGQIAARDWKDYQTEAETELEKWFEQSASITEDPVVKAQYEKLKQSIQDQKNRVFELHQESVNRKLTEEIVLRYAYREGLYQYQLTHDPAIQQAVSVLQDPSKYQKILR